MGEVYNALNPEQPYFGCQSSQAVCFSLTPHLPKMNDREPRSITNELLYPSLNENAKTLCGCSQTPDSLDKKIATV